MKILKIKYIEFFWYKKFWFKKIKHHGFHDFFIIYNSFHIKIYKFSHGFLDQLHV